MDYHDLYLKFDKLKTKVEEQSKTISFMMTTIIIGFLIFAALPWIIFAVLIS